MWIDFDDDASCGPGCVTATQSIFVLVCETVHYSSSDSNPCNNDGEVAVINPNKPCPGDPVKYPEIAKQNVSGVGGGTFSDNFRKYRDGSKKIHAGLDIKTFIGEPIYSMTSGTVDAVYENDQLGYTVLVNFTWNGESHTMLYAHLKSDGRPVVGTQLNPGSLIGFSGKSGNIRRPTGEHHVHIESWKGSYQRNPSQKHNLALSRPNHVNPMQFMHTQFDANFNPINPCMGPFE